MQPVIDGDTRLLVVAPHPDDETLGAGMLIQRVLAAGGRVDVLLLTDGDDNPWPQRWSERRLVVGRAGRIRWGQRRRAEAAAALGCLGVAADGLHALGWHDMQVTRGLRSHHGPAVAAVRGVIDRVKPTLVVIPDLADTHPDHGAAHVLARLALSDAGSLAIVLTYLVHAAQTEASGVAVEADTDPRRLAVKTAAMHEHGTQLILSRERMLGYATQPEAFAVAPSADAGRSLRLPWHPGVLVRARLRLLLADGQGSVVWPWHKAPLQRIDGDWVLTLRGAPGPSFVKLTADLSTPWIHDRYGWTCAGLVARPSA